jgi:hypothetical protein
MALVAAARDEAAPFANPIYLELAHSAQDDPQISALALALWLEIVGKNVAPADLRWLRAFFARSRLSV